MEELLEAGKIVNTHGLRGELKILPWADSPEFLLQFDQFYVDAKPYAVESSRVHKTCVLAKLAGIDTIEQAQALQNRVVWIDRNQVELEEGSVFVADLVGLQVINQAGATVGKITDVLTLPANDVYVVQGEGTEYMIPVVEEFVEEIAVAEGYVRVRLIEGMGADAD